VAESNCTRYKKGPEFLHIKSQRSQKRQWRVLMLWALAVPSNLQHSVDSFLQRKDASRAAKAQTEGRWYWLVFCGCGPP
jgi:hypothetical protein